MDIRNNLLLFLTGAPRRLGFDYGGGGFSLTDLVTPDLMHPHHADMLTQLVVHLGGKPVLDRPTVHVSEADRRAANDFWTQHGLDNGDLVVGIHPGAGDPVRYWGLDKFAAVADALAKKFPVRFLAFSQPDGYGWDMPLQAQHVRVKPDIGLLMALLEKCDLLLCNDGGPMHIAAGVGTPVVAIFGPTEPKWWAPYGPNHTVLILEGFPCRPCGDRCKFSQPYCLTDLSVTRVIAALEGRLAGLLAMRKVNANSSPLEAISQRQG
jgi:ADP-heptose:LPS heptosyltransferase